MKFKNGDVLVARITSCLENGKTAFIDFLVHDQVGQLRSVKDAYAHGWNAWLLDLLARATFEKTQALRVLLSTPASDDENIPF